MLNLVIYLNQTLIFEWFVVNFGSKIGAKTHVSKGD
jgi:hypothetical protein